MKTFQKFEKAVRVLWNEFERAQADKTIHKPMANALYRTWRFFDEKEKERKADDDGQRSDCNT